MGVHDSVSTNPFFRSRFAQTLNVTFLKCYLVLYLGGELPIYLICWILLDSPLWSMRRNMHLQPVLFGVLCLFQGVAAWNDLGHRTVALLARKYLHEDALKYFDRVLPAKWDFSDHAVWASSIVSQRPWTRGWHYTGRNATFVCF